MIRSISILTLFFISFNLYAQDQEKAWNVNNPKGNWDFTELKLNTDEGTWMNLDISPDGSKIVFDLLGDIYIINTSGGNAKVLREGLAFEIQPRFSPDGKKVAYMYDNNLYVKHLENGHELQITKDGEKNKIINDNWIICNGI